MFDLSNATWFKSSKSGPYTDNCVEVAFVENNVIAVRNSNTPAQGVVLFNDAEWDAFLAGVKDNEFDRG